MHISRVSRSSRSPLMATLRRCWRKANNSDNPNPGFEPRGPENLISPERRRFVQGTMALGAASLLPGCKPQGRKSDDSTRIAIIGAGIAGLTATHHLVKGGLEPVVFEAGARTGGRILTLTDVVGPGLYTEAGGEFIDSGHADMLSLAAELGLTVVDSRGPNYPSLNEFAFFFGGRLRGEKETVSALREMCGAMAKDIAALPKVISAGATGLAAELDRTPLDRYLESRGVTGWLRDLILAAYVTEFGLDPGEQSSLNLLTLIGFDLSACQLKIFGDSDERFRIVGGNQTLTDGLARLHQDRIRLSHRLEAMAGGHGGFQLTFQTSGGTREILAEAVLLALPFTMLRQVRMDIDLPPLKKKAIAELGYGTNSKLFLGFSSRPWRRVGQSGYFFSDSHLQSGWDHTFTQASPAGGMTLFSGGRQGLDMGATPLATQADAAAEALEAIFPGAREARNGRIGAFNWPSYPLSFGSYACYKPGQWTTLGGEEGRRVGNVFFAGEHCSREFQGYMNGGAATGREAAEAILQQCGHGVSQKPTPS